MSRKDVYATISAIVPCAHMAWDEGSAPGLPWAVYYLEGRDGAYADDVTYARKSHWVVELYQREFDSSLEERVEAAIEAAFGPARVTELWVDAEHCLMTVYRFTEIGE